LVVVGHHKELVVLDFRTELVMIGIHTDLAMFEFHTGLAAVVEIQVGLVGFQSKETAGSVPVAYIDQLSDHTDSHFAALVACMMLVVLDPNIHCSVSDQLKSSQNCYSSTSYQF
jgi:hypothetical protein